MRFSLYTELQLHPGKTPSSSMGRCSSRSVNADRLGYDSYAVDRALLLPEVLRLGQPDCALRRGCAAHAEHPLPHDAARAAVPQPDGARQRHPRRRTSSRAGATSGASAAGTAGFPRRPASRSTSTPGPGTRRRSTCSSRRSATSASPTAATTSRSTTRTSSRSSTRSFRIYLGGTSDRTYTLAAEHGWGVAVPPLLPYKALEQQLDLYRASCAEHGTTPDIVWIHACHLDDDRETAMREGRDWITASSRGTARR